MTINQLMAALYEAERADITVEPGTHIYIEKGDEFGAGHGNLEGLLCVTAKRKFYTRAVVDPMYVSAVMVWIPKKGIEP